MNKKILLFGSTGKLGNSIKKNASTFGYDVIGFGRSKDKDCIAFHKVNFCDYFVLKKEIISSFRNNPSAIVFTQRSRLNNEFSHDDFYKGLEAELNPYLALQEVLDEIEPKKDLNIVTVGSNAAMKLNYDISNSYHIIKSSTLSAGLALTMNSKKYKIFSNGVIFGEIENSYLLKNSEIKQNIFNAIKEVNSNVLTDIEDVSNLILTLCSANKLKLSGQIINSDAGINNFSIESLIRIIQSKKQL